MSVREARRLRSADPMGHGTLVVEDKLGRRSELAVQDGLTIGRAPSSDILIDAPGVSRAHAVIRRATEGHFLLADLGSANGTTVNGRMISTPHELRNEDVIRIGESTIRFVGEIGIEEPDSTATGDATLVRNPPRERAVLGTSQKMTEVFALTSVAASSPIPVLLEGETGTGKELVARAIHEASRRASGPFVPVNCAALTETLLESELFGHRKGAFTGANQDHRGLFEAATSGTIFLDEVGEMPLTMQSKLLRVLEENEIVPVGETRPRKIDIRVISATNRDLAREIEAGAFRSDLFFRLATFPIRLPPLRERREDIALLARNALAQAASRHGKRVSGISSEAMAALERFHWPGNVRELRNEMQRAVALNRDGGGIELRHLSEKVTAMAGRGAPSPVPNPSASAPSAWRPNFESVGFVLDRPFVAASDDIADSSGADEGAAEGPASRDIRQARAEFEARYIAEVLRENDGHISNTARALGLSRVALHKKMKDYGIRS